jgi:hypothetical protein
LTLAGVRLDVLETGWDASVRPAIMDVCAKNIPGLVDRLGLALARASVHEATVADMTASVKVLSMVTDKRKIRIRLQPVG